MRRYRLGGALVALVAALTATTLVAPAAVAKPAAPKTPSVAAVAKIFPHIKGGDADTDVERKIEGPKNCRTDKVVKGAVGRSTAYTPDPAKFGDGFTADSPMPIVEAIRFPSSRAAAKYVHGVKVVLKCPAEDGSTATRLKVKKVGAQALGYQLVTTIGEDTYVMDLLVARRGKVVVTVSTVSMDAHAPSLAKTTQLARLAVRTAS